MDQRDLLGTLDLATIAGWAVFELDGQLVESGVWHTEGGDLDGDRWLAFRAEAIRWLRRWGPRFCGIAIERPVMYGRPGQDWVTGRVMFGQAAHVESLAAQQCIPTVMITPSEIKRLFTGNGNAPKSLMIATAERIYGPLSTPSGGDNQAERKRREKARGDEADARALGPTTLALYRVDELRRRRFVGVASG